MDMLMPRVKLELVLIRHGTTKWNVERRYLGHTDLPLLPSSNEDLAQLKLQLQLQAELSEGFWRVYCSDLLRCRETLEQIMPMLVEAAQYDSRLREMNFGAWEGCTYEQLKDNGLYRSWIDNPAGTCPPNGESWGTFAGRVSSFLAELGQAAAEAAEVAYTAGHAAGHVAEHAARHAAGQENSEECFLTQAVTSTSPSARRVLIVTHGGVIRELLAQTVPGLTFRNAVAPLPGAVTTVRMLWNNGQWNAEII